MPLLHRVGASREAEPHRVGVLQKAGLHRVGGLENVGHIPVQHVPELPL